MADTSRRRLLKGAAATAALAAMTVRTARGASLLAVRVWPGPDYTRVTLEHDEPLKFSHFVLRDAPPPRLVVDLEGIALTAQLKELVGKVKGDDPYIAAVRIGQNRPDVVRLVIELKGDLVPQVYQLDPIGPYRYRLLFDLYPASANDPLMALVRSTTAVEEPPSEPADSAAAADPSAPPAAAPAATASAPADPSATAPSASTDSSDLGREIERAQRAAEPPASADRARPNGKAVRRLITIAIVELDEVIALARQQHAHLRVVADQRREPARHRQGDGFFVRAAPSGRTRILAAVAGIDRDRDQAAHRLAVRPRPVG